MGGERAGEWQGQRHRDLRNPVLAAMRAPALAISVALIASAASTAAAIHDEVAGAPTDLAVTVYRAPYRESGSIDLDSLAGFALVTETRLVHLPAGLSR